VTRGAVAAAGRLGHGVRLMTEGDTMSITHHTGNNLAAPARARPAGQTAGGRADHDGSEGLGHQALTGTTQGD
jgi:hypothetical protein